MISVSTFVEKLRACFGEGVQLPVAFWRSNEPVAQSDKIAGCFFKGFRAVLDGEPLSLSLENCTCGGGRFYLGFTDMPERVPRFVSLTEKYKRTSEDVLEFVKDIDVKRGGFPYVNFVRLDQLALLDEMEGLLFFATPDVLSGLCGWAFFDNNDDGAVSTLFGSGCSTMITNVITENERGGQRCYLGLFDPSVRPQVGVNELGFSIPRSRLMTMLDTMDDCFLNGSPAWEKVRQRIDNPTD